ncbi:hypothetical protein ACEQPO_30905 [Bacillus sp. SL00103]
MEKVTDVVEEKIAFDTKHKRIVLLKKEKRRCLKKVKKVIRSIYAIVKGKRQSGV